MPYEPKLLTAHYPDSATTLIGKNEREGRDQGGGDGRFRYNEVGWEQRGV